MVNLFSTDCFFNFSIRAFVVLIYNCKSVMTSLLALDLADPLTLYTN